MKKWRIMQKKFIVFLLDQIISCKVQPFKNSFLVRFGFQLITHNLARSSFEWTNTITLPRNADSVQKPKTQKHKKCKNITSYSCFNGNTKRIYNEEYYQSLQGCWVVSTLHGDSPHSILSVDRSAATSVRHW